MRNKILLPIIGCLVVIILTGCKTTGCKDYQPPDDIDAYNCIREKLGLLPINRSWTYNFEYLDNLPKDVHFKMRMKEWWWSSEDDRFSKEIQRDEYGTILCEIEYYSSGNTFDASQFDPIDVKRDPDTGEALIDPDKGGFVYEYREGHEGFSISYDYQEKILSIAYTGVDNEIETHITSIVERSKRPITEQDDIRGMYINVSHYNISISKTDNLMIEIEQVREIRAYIMDRWGLSITIGSPEPPPQ